MSHVHAECRGEGEGWCKLEMSSDLNLRGQVLQRTVATSGDRRGRVRDDGGKGIKEGSEREYTNAR